MLGSALLSCKEQTDQPVQIEKSGSAEDPVKIPELEYSKFESSVAFLEDKSVGELYNGTEWTVISIDAVITVTKTQKTRRIRLEGLKIIEVTREEWKIGDPFERYEPQPIKPYSSGSVKGSGSSFMKDLGKEDISWGIVSARGYKE